MLCNRRVGKRINGVLVQDFLYQGKLRPIAELYAGGNLTDHLGSVRYVVNTATGAVAQQLDIISI